MFTGKRRKDSDSTPTELVKDLDPAIERVILRCLEEDPKRRPSSALNIAMALPGGDPIAAALAAGETPSPEMVAASQEKEGFGPRTAWICLVSVVAFLAAMSAMHGRLDLQARAPLEIAPEALAFRAQTILGELGYAGKPADSSYGFDCCDIDYLASLERLEPERRDALLATHQPAVIRFWYRQHRNVFLADSFLVNSPLPPSAPLQGVVTYASPANTEPGMIRMMLSPSGALIALEAQPSTEDLDAAPAPPDWNAVFAAAGLDPARFAPAPPQRVPPVAFDTHAAWTGAYAEGRTEQVLVEAASWRGRAVFFHARGDWQQQPEPASTLPIYAYTAMFVFAVVVLAVGVVLARRNLRLGRGDRHGAAWIAGMSIVSLLSSWIFVAHHVAGTWELALFIKALCWSAFVAGAASVLYLAVEPHARRYWPDSLISLTRLQAGRLRDPLVASHILGGMAASLGTSVLMLAAVWAASGGTALYRPRIDALSSSAYATGILLFDLLRSFFGPLVVLTFLVAMRLLVRRMWIAYLLTGLVLGSITAGVQAWVYPSPAAAALLVLNSYVSLILLRRWGVLSLVAWGFIGFFVSMPLPAASWYAGQSALLLSIPAAIAAWSLWVILSAERRSSLQTAETAS